MTRAVLLVLAADDSRDDLTRELRALGEARELEPGLFECAAHEPHVALPALVFARQQLPDARALNESSIRAWAGALVDAVAGVLPDHQPWSLHVYPFRAVVSTGRLGARAWHSRKRAGKAQRGRDDDARPAVGYERCRLIREAAVELLHKRRRHLLRYLRPEPSSFGPDEALVQLLLVAPDRGYLSVAPAPLPFEGRHRLSCFSGGRVELASDKQAPSRAFAKLVEAEARMGRRIAARETCVDLGAAPGSWSYVAMRRGAKVTAVDRSELRPDLMGHKSVKFQRGDAFRFEPAAPVDWLICDVIAAAERSAELLLRWLHHGWCRHFVVTLKLDDTGNPATLASLKHALPLLSADHWLLRLCANKKEVCAFGSTSRAADAAGVVPAAG
jgi:23S rRNA (cytidine2498-2'-O)-methyltransferase